MRKIFKSSGNFGYKNVSALPDDKICVQNVYLSVVTSPYKTSQVGEEAIRLSDELALLTKYYSSQLSSSSMKEFVDSLNRNNISIAADQLGDAFQFVRSRYIQNPSELRAYIDEQTQGLNEMVERGRYAFHRSEAAKAAAAARLAEKEKAKTEPKSD